MRRKYTRWVGMLAMSAVLALSTACDIADELLQVDNPEQIQVELLDDVALLDVQVQGVIGNMVDMMDTPIIEYATYISDEVLTGLNWEDYARVSQRIVLYLEGPVDDIFGEPSRALRQAHDLAERIRVWQGEFPDENYDDELALVLVHAGYAAVVMAEHMCQTVISLVPDEPSDQILSQAQTFQAAIPYLQEGLSLATAEGEDDLADLARTGLARAYLGQGSWADAATYAGAVTAGFEWWLEYSDANNSEYNGLQNTSHGSNFTLGINPFFTGVHPSFDGTGFAFEDNDVIDAQTDPRVQHMPTDRTGHNRLTRLYKLFQGLRYSEYNGETIAPASAACPACTGTDEDDMELIAEYYTDILLADYTEAQHHYFEALAMQGGNEAEVLAFVNTRRAVGNQASVTLSGQDLIDELRRQRGKDLFMGGFRVGDLRRWSIFDAGNGPFAGGSYFPVGTHPNAQWGEYGPWTCYPLPLEEYEGNPNLVGQKPADPSVPPAGVI